MGVRRRPPRRPWRRSIPAADGSVCFRSRGILAVEAGREAHSTMIVSTGVGFAAHEEANLGKRMRVRDRGMSATGSVVPPGLSAHDRCPHRRQFVPVSKGHVSLLKPS